MKSFLFIIFLSLSTFAFGQMDSLKINFDTLKLEKNCQFSTDNLGFIYVITPNNDIEKYNDQFKKLATANFKVYGSISSIDATNPFEIYVFYRDQSKVVYLDNMLNYRGETDLNSLGISQSAVVSRSFDNQLWVMDMSDLKLKKINKENKLLFESNPLNLTSSDNIISPTQLVDINSKLYLLNQGSIYVFDLFGNYEKIMLSDSISSFQIFKDKVFYLKNGMIFTYDMQQVILTKKIEPLYPFKMKQFRIEKGKTLFLISESLILQKD